MIGRIFTRTNIGRLTVLALLVAWVLWALPTAAKADTTVVAGATPITAASGAAITAASAAPAGASPTSVAAAATVQDRGNIVEFGNDVFLGPGQRARTVTVFGGDVTVAGTIDHNLTVFGGSVTLEPTAVVGSGMDSSDVAVTVVGGKVVREAGATVVGRTWHGWGGLHAHHGAFAASLGIFGFLGGIGRTIFLTAIAVVVAAIAPRRVAAARDIVGRRPLPAFGWGAAGLLIGVPVVSIALAITIIGIVVLVPWLLFVVPITVAAGYAAVAAFVGGWLLQRLSKGSTGIVSATALGAVAMSLALFVPFIGGLAVFVAGLIGLGAVLMVAADWSRARRAARKARVAAPDQSSQPGAGGPPQVIDGTAS